MKDNENELLARIAELETIKAAAEKLVRCKGRYHSEQNYRALAELFGVTVPDLPPLDGEQTQCKPVADLYALLTLTGTVYCYTTSQYEVEQWMQMEGYKAQEYVKLERIESLLAEREADKALIAEQKKRIDFLKEQLAQLANFNPDWDKLEAATYSLREHMAELTAANKRIAELEARTLTVKLPEAATEGGKGYRQKAIWVLREACADAGITLVVGGEDGKI